MNPQPPASPHSVLIIGGGLAGLAAAVALALRGFHVTLLESKQRLGGRAGSFIDPASGQMVDACQHVSMGCCTSFERFCRTVGIQGYLAPQPRLYFVTPDRRMSVFKADPWPAPFHLGRALMGAHYLTQLDKLRVVYGLLALMWQPADADPPLLDFLMVHRQNQRTIERFWGVVLTSALNETVDRVGLKYARKVFRDGFFRDRQGFEVRVPTVPLGKLYGPELITWLTSHGVEVRDNTAVRRIEIEEKTASGSTAPSYRVSHVTLRDGTTLAADSYILAVPFERVAELLPAEVVAREPFFGNLKNLSPSPITSVHLWFDRAVLDLSHAVLVDCLGQWVFNRGEVVPGEHYIQVVVSASRPLHGLGRDEVASRVVEELMRIFPKMKAARLLRTKVVTEHAATFSAVPGVDQWRPVQASPIGNLAVAGDWTATGWPATMEGAVRSGELAADVIRLLRNRLE